MTDEHHQADRMQGLRRSFLLRGRGRGTRSFGRPNTSGTLSRLSGLPSQGVFHIGLFPCGGATASKRRRRRPGRYFRPRKEPSLIKTQPLEIASFPIEEIMDDLLRDLLDGTQRIHLVVGPTGSGKSTWLPFRLLTCGKLVQRGPICVTQPRIPATEGPSAFVGKLFYGDGEKVESTVGPGLVVGYRHGEVGLSKTDAANRLIFMTDGTLLNELISGEVGKYSVVIIDEAHERSVNIDMILSLLKAKLPQFPHLHIIIASATVDASGFEGFFGGPGKVARYESKGFTYPILEVFSDETVAHWPQSPDEKFLSLWEKVDEETVRAEWLGPVPCWGYTSLDRYRLRYYPHFETLVFQGIMSDEELKRLSREGKDPHWQKAVQTLCENSRRKRRVGAEESIPITESVRGPVGGGSDRFPIKVQQGHKDRLAYAVVNAVCELVKREEVEARQRLERWERRGSYGWEKLKKPYPCGHILAFLPTTTQIDQCYDLLVKELPSLPGESGERVLPPP